MNRDVNSGMNQVSINPLPYQEIRWADFERLLDAERLSHSEFMRRMNARGWHWYGNRLRTYHRRGSLDLHTSEMADLLRILNAGPPERSPQ